MPLPADTRRAGEWILRAVLVSTLGLALWWALREATAAGATRAKLSVSTLGPGVARLLSTAPVRGVDLAVDAAPARADRDLLVALRRSGVSVEWHGTTPSVALSVMRAREPDAAGRISVVNSAAGDVVIADSAGRLETVKAARGATLAAGTLVGAVVAASDGFAARAQVPGSDERRAVLLLGRTDWEMKFVSAALIETGWTVRSSSPVAPGIVVHDDGLLPLDTSRYDAVIALDTTAAEFSPSIARFVAQGGGLVAVGTALDLQAIGSIAPAKSGSRTPGRILLAEDTVTTRDLPQRPLVEVRHDAVALAREGTNTLVAGHRVGLGRVLSVGYDETWRWRMLGGESGLALHRDWWSHAVGSVAPSRDTAQVADNADAAPRAALIDALGPASSESAARSSVRHDALPFWLLPLIVAALVAETASRRFRGAR